jgi:putative transposase
MGEERAAERFDTALNKRIKAVVHWRRRHLSEATGISVLTVHLTLFGLQPHHSKSAKLSTDP